MDSTGIRRFSLKVFIGFLGLTALVAIVSVLAGERRSLVVYLNRYPRAHVRIPGVSEALGLGQQPEAFVILHDHRSGLQFLRQSRDLRDHGLELSLDGYGCHVFLGFEEVSDGGGAGWAELAQRLGLAGVPDAHAALRRMRDAPVREAVPM